MAVASVPKKELIKIDSGREKLRINGQLALRDISSGRIMGCQPEKRDGLFKIYTVFLKFRLESIDTIFVRDELT